MLTPPLPADEKQRLEAVRSYRILDTPPEPDFDDLVALASEICDVPIAAVTLMDEDRQWFKAITGVDVRELPRSISFCGHAILKEGVFVVEDALKDPRFADNPLVTHPPHVRFYAGAPLQTDAGFKLGTLCVIDRTPRQLSSFQGRALQILSRQVVAQMELRARIFELARIQRQKEELTSLVVHDLKNPLMSMSANAHHLSNADELSAKRRAAAVDIETAAASMHRMVMNILDISQSEDGSLSPRLADVDVVELIEEVRRVAERRAQQEGQSIEVSLGLIDRVICADGELLRRVLENLVDNALKYGNSGSIVEIEARSVDDGVELRVRDGGPGVPDSYKTRIFEKYFQLERDADSHRHVSRGLGLAFCQLAVEAHGGRIWVEDNRPQGSCFSIYLPAMEH